MNKNLVKLHENQKTSLMDEAQKAGLSLAEIQEIPLTDPNSLVMSSLKALAGGRYKPDYLQLFSFQDNQFYVQPYSGLACLPGEHYVLQNGGLNHGLAFRPPLFGKPNWFIPQDKKATKEFRRANTALVRASRTTKMEWPIGLGTVDLDWGYQLIGLERGKSLLTMKAGRYGGFTTYHVGFQQFAKIQSALSEILEPQGEGPREVMFPPGYFHLIEEKIARK